MPPPWPPLVVEDIRSWVPQRTRSITFTYVVDPAGHLVRADRHAEHVACARGQSVLGAGEIVFELTAEGVTISEVTNQSTGYCPEPECWPAVRDALIRADLEPPDGLKVEMPECLACGTSYLSPGTLLADTRDARELRPACVSLAQLGIRVIRCSSRGEPGSMVYPHRPLEEARSS